jgi:hypothetical protein
MRCDTASFCNSICWSTSAFFTLFCNSQLGLRQYDLRLRRHHLRSGPGPIGLLAHQTVDVINADLLSARFLIST